MSEHAEPRRPALSVVIVVFAGGRLVKRTLAALERQERVHEPVEVIVAAARDFIHEQVVHSAAPGARLVQAAPDAHPAQLRALGVRLARAPIVACTEDHCVPARDWCARILEAHRAHAPVIGGAIQKLQPDTSLAWAAYLLEYGRYMPPLAGGPAAYLSDCNVSYKRAALDEIAGVWQESFHETRVHDAIREKAGSQAIVLDPSIVVMQSRHPGLGAFLRERFDHGRLFARLRAARYSTGARVGYAAASLGLMPLLVGRALKTAWRGRETRIGAIRALPHLLLAAASWSVGEGVGALTADRTVP